MFFYNSTLDPLTGGIGRVSNVLAEYFESKGCKVYFLSRVNDSSYKEQRQYYLIDDREYLSKENIEYFKSFLINNKIDILINQSGMSQEASRLAYFAKELEIPVISVIHNTLIGSIQNFSSAYYDRFKKFHLQKVLFITDKRMVKGLILSIYKQKYKNHYKELCNKSSKVILLSKAFFAEIKFFTGSEYKYKLMDISNPVSFGTDYSILSDLDKRKELLYVGVVNFSQKRVDLLLQIWEKVSIHYSDWNLKIVGEGVDFEKAKKLCIDMKLKNVSFMGFQNPQEYYKKASIFCMTSSFEGFGIVLVEAMQHGAVPIAFNSYLSITDIIDDHKNGILIPPFDIENYVKELSKLMVDKEYRDDLAKSAMEKSKKFSIDRIGKKWERLLLEYTN